MGDACRPDSFDGFVGQERPKKVLEILCKAAKRKGSCPPHVLLSGPPGLGKTTLARIVANEMQSRLVEVVASNLQSPDEMAKHLLRLKERDVLFIDEIHGLPRGVEEVLYAASKTGESPWSSPVTTTCSRGSASGRSSPRSRWPSCPPSPASARRP